MCGPWTGREARNNNTVVVFTIHTFAFWYWDIHHLAHNLVVSLAGYQRLSVTTLYKLGQSVSLSDCQELKYIFLALCTQASLLQQQPFKSLIDARITSLPRLNKHLRNLIKGMLLALCTISSFQNMLEGHLHLCILVLHPHHSTASEAVLRLSKPTASQLPHSCSLHCSKL